MKTIFFLGLIFLFSTIKVFSQQDGDYQTINDGDWEDIANWEYYYKGWEAASVLPDFSAGVVTINHLMTNVPTVVNIDGQMDIYKNITFDEITGSGIIYVYSTSSSIQINCGNIATGTMEISGLNPVTLNVYGDWDLITFSDLNFLSTINFYGNKNISKYTSFNNISIETGTRILTYGSGTSYVYGDFDIKSGATFSANTGSINFYDPVHNYGTFIDNHSNGIVTFSDSLVVNTGAIFSTTSNTVSGRLIVNGGNVMNNGTFNAGSVQCKLTSSFSGTQPITVNNIFNVFSGTTTNNILESNGGITVVGAINGGAGTNLVNLGLITFKGTDAPMSAATLTTTDANSKFIYNGTASQSMKATTYHKLTINNNAGTTLNGIITVNNNLDLTLGVVTISSSSNYIHLISGATATNHGNSSYISGKCRKTGSTAFTFPIGKGGFYAPASMSAANLATDAFEAEYFNVDPQTIPYNVNSREATLSNISRNEYWYVSRVAGSTNIDLTLTWLTARSGTISDISKLRVARWSGSQWEDKGIDNVTGNVNSGAITNSNLINSYGPFTLGSVENENPLEVVLVDFIANCNENIVDLKWITLSENNSSHFEIEFSENAIDWKMIGMVESAGSSNIPREYNFVSRNVAEDAFYRLKMVDLDGAYKLSNIVALRNCGGGEIDMRFFPNPVNDYIVVEVSEELIGGVLIICNSLNVTLVEEVILSKNQIINLENLDSGFYFVSLLKIDKPIISEKLIVK